MCKRRNVSDLLELEPLINVCQLYIYSQINQFVHVVCYWVLRAAEDVRRTQSNEWNTC
jgi:hypothetical protein